MRVLADIRETRAACRQLRQAGKSIGLVPTMGALHEGHLSLVRAARSCCDSIVVSIFVNPTQFGPSEDLAKYPRTFDRDCALLEREGVDIVFAPSAGEMYPPGAFTFVDVEGVSGRLDGASRPAHFRGVSTVVAKLFHVTTPDRAFFGQKDAAQLAVLRKMVRDLNFEVQLVACPIVREDDGLAMSSRNSYLTGEQRRHALVLSRALWRVRELIAGGVFASDRLTAAMREVIEGEAEVRVDYISIIDADTLEALEDARIGALIAVAAYVGETRLIDNLLVEATQ